MTVTTLAADWDRLGDTLVTAIVDTLIMVSVTLLVAGILGLALGVLLYTTRPGGILQNKFIYFLINVAVNFVRPIPFIILLAFVQPLTVAVMGGSIGRNPATFVMVIAATFAVARIVEQNLMAIDPGVIEAARAMGASPWKISARWSSATPSSSSASSTCPRWPVTWAAAAWVTSPSSTVTAPSTGKSPSSRRSSSSSWSRPPSSSATGSPPRSCAAKSPRMHAAPPSHEDGAARRSRASLRNPRPTPATSSARPHTRRQSREPRAG